MKLYSLIGEKLGHSLSPEIHTYIFKKLHINAAYSLMEIGRQNIPNVISALKTLEYSGINITIPYKEAIIPYLDEISSEAAKIGAVNTVKIENNSAKGYNTDYFGFGAMLKRDGIHAEGKKIAILGSGGAAKAVIAYFSDNMPKSIAVIARCPEKCHSLKLQFPNIEILGYEALENLDGDILVNTTPVGMYPNNNAIPVSEEVICRFSACADIVYNPLQTSFLKSAEKNNIKTSAGLYMLIGQAIKAQEIFQGRSIDLSVGEEIYNTLKNRF